MALSRTGGYRSVTRVNAQEITRLCQRNIASTKRNNPSGSAR
jgi:hypothetical protein